MQHVDLVVAQMRKFADSNKLLVAFGEDLTVHDRNILIKMDGWRSFAWIVSTTSSDIYPLGLHQQFNQDLIDIANVRGSSGARFCWINPERAKHDGGDIIVPVTKDAFVRSIRSATPYRYERGQVFTPSGSLAAKLHLKYEYVFREGLWRCDFTLQPVMPGFRYSWGVQLAVREAVYTHGLFCRVYDTSEVKGEESKAA